MSASPTAVSPVFLLSTARSGSTLLQRILGWYPEIATVPEPWVLLPLLYATRRSGVYAEYEHSTLVSAMEDFRDSLPRGAEDYKEELRRFVLGLYQRHAEPQHRYFLDKTPPYFLIVKELFEYFPDAKFIFLWRNPLAVAASLAAWPQRNWGGLYRENLFFGLAELIEAYEHRCEVAHAVRFEDYVSGDESTWRALLGYLEMEFDPASLVGFAGVELDGRMGDKSGVAQYRRLSSEPTTKWREVLSNPLRKEAARRYLAWIGRERLAVMGYDGDELLRELEEARPQSKGLARDAMYLGRALLKEPIHFHMRRRVNVTRPSSLRYLLGAERTLR